ncbi:unnamed protein product [Symbiodinium sp. CCMP2456]|nr:unnamed protein product [Symbiodinium sp. CCMP2456]
MAQTQRGRVTPTDAACIVPLVADLLALHDAARECNGDGGDLEASARAALARSALPPAPDGLQIAQARLSTALLPELIEGLDDRLDLAHNGCPPRKRGYDHYVKLLPNAGRVLEAAAGVTGIPTDHLLVAALASALSSAANLAQVKLSLIVPMRDGPGHGQAVANLASTRHLSVRLRGRSLIDIALDLSMRFRRRDWQISQLLDDDGDRLFINLRSIPVFDGASPVIEPQDTTRSPTRFVRNIVEMFADQETLYSWTLWLGLREDVCGEAFSRALRRALWGQSATLVSSCLIQTNLPWPFAQLHDSVGGRRCKNANNRRASASREPLSRRLNETFRCLAAFSQTPEKMLNASALKDHKVGVPSKLVVSRPTCGARLRRRAVIPLVVARTL